MWTYLISWAVLSIISYVLTLSLYSFEQIIHIFLAINISTFLMYGFDKFQAQAKTRRTPEKVLYLMTFLGGAVGAIMGMQMFRHKTRKMSFQLVVALLILIQVLIVLFVLDLLTLTPPFVKFSNTVLF